MQLDIIGKIPNAPGFHVNTPEPVPQWEGWRLDPRPATPVRCYQGRATAPVCYKFPGQGTFDCEYQRVFGHVPEPDETPPL